MLSNKQTLASRAIRSIERLPGFLAAMCTAAVPRIQFRKSRGKDWAMSGEMAATLCKVMGKSLDPGISAQIAVLSASMISNSYIGIAYSGDTDDSAPIPGKSHQSS